MALSLTYDAVLSRVQITGTTYLNANPFFEADALNWSAVGGTFVRSTAQFHQGTASGLLTPDGVTANTRAVSESVPATPGVTYRLSAWLRCAVSRNVNLQSIFFDAGAASLGTTNTSVALTAGTWTFAELTVTAPPTTATGILRVEMTSTPPAGHTLHIDEAMIEPSPVVVERSTNQVTWVTVRGGADLPSGTIALDDYEFAADVANYYRVAGRGGYGPPLNANPYFETNSADWFAAGGTFVRSTAQFHEGVASGLLTPSGVAAEAKALTSALVPAVVGGSYRSSAWVRCAVARNVVIGIDWHQGGGAYISSTVQSVAVAANTWTLLEVTGTAPALTGQARMTVSMTGTPLASHLLHVDEATLSPAGITPVLDGVWLKSLARPFLNRKVTVTDWSDVERPSRSGVFPIVGRSFPIAVTDLHGSRQWTLDVVTQDAQDTANLDLLISTGEVQFVHVPADCPVPAGYVALGDTSQRRPRPRATRRIFSMPFTECAQPGPDVIPAVGTCQTVINTYATCSAVLAAHPTCADLLQLVGSPGDVIVP